MIMGMPETEVVKVQMFEDLVLRYRQNLVSSHDFHSDKIAKLLVYFLMNHTRIIEGSELCDFLWQKGESNNPIGALKNLVYRLRVTLKDTLKRDDFIVTKRGAYGWNPDILCELDFEIFEGNLLSSNDRIYADMTRYNKCLLMTQSFVFNILAFN